MTDPVSRLSVDASTDAITVLGDLDAHTCSDLTAALDTVPGTGDIRLDASGVEFMDSSGLRALISGHQRAESADRRLVIVRPAKAVSRIIEISGLASHLHIVDA